MLQQFIEITKTFINSQNLLQLSSLCLLWITSLSILASVVYKFTEYKSGKKTKLQAKSHLIETFSMAFMIIIIFNILQKNLGAFTVTFTDNLIALIFGGFLALLGTCLHIWSKIAIGKYWSNQIEIIEDHHLVTTGPYAIVRHPMYSSLILWLIGLSFIFLNYAALGVTLFVFVPMMIIRASAEDKLLRELDKTSFAVYSRSMSQLIPRFSGLVSLLLRLLVIALFGYSLITMQMSISRFAIIFLAHLLTGILIKVPKISFSYINKSFIMLIIFVTSLYSKPAFWFLYLVLFFDIWGLFLNCPCMIIYDKYNRCPCFDLIKGCVCKIKK